MSHSVAVVIPTYNRSEHVRCAIESALAQQRRCDEIIVVDDGSTDGTPEALAAFGTRIRAMRQQNQGAAAARNTGIRAAQSDWITFLDSDDELEPTRLQQWEADLRQWPDIVAHCGNALFCEGGKILHDHFSLRGLQAGDTSHHEVRPLANHVRVQFLTPTFAVRRDVLLAEGGFPTHVRLFEDFHLMTRIALHGPWVWTERPLARVYRRGPESSNTFLAVPDKALRMGESLVSTFATLLQRAELDATERRLVRDRLAAALADVADALRANGRYGGAVAAYARSVRADPSWRALMRALVGCTVGRAVVNRLRGRSPA